MQGQMSFEDHGTIVDNPKGNREPAWDKDIGWFELPDDDEIHLYRMVAAPYYYAQHWIQSFKKDKKPGKSFPVICQNYDSATNTYAENGCESCLFMDEVNNLLKDIEKTVTNPKDKLEWKDLPAHITKQSRRTTMAQNVIVRDLQAQGAPSNNAQKWSFIRPLRFPQGFGKTLKEHQAKFNKRDGQEWALNHRTEGKDLQLSYNSSSEDKNKIYMLALGDITPLTDEEMKHAPFLTDFKSFLKYPQQSEIASALRRFGYYDWINEMRTSRPSTSVPKAPPAQQTQAINKAPQGPATAFDVQGQPEPPFEPEPAATATQSSPAPQATQQAPIAAAPAAAPAAPVIAPQQTMTMQQQTPVTPPAAPVQAAPAAPVAPTQPPAQTPAQAGVEGRLQSFSTQTGVPLIVTGKTYTKALRLYRADLAVPTCWSTYSATSRANREQCKQCPLRLDCMMATG